MFLLIILCLGFGWFGLFADFELIGMVLLLGLTGVCVCCKFVSDFEFSVVLRLWGLSWCKWFGFLFLVVAGSVGLRIRH